MGYIKRLLNWFWEGKYLFLFIVFFCFIFFLNKIKIEFSLENKIRIFGLFLQIVGAITIIHSLKDKLILFKGHGLIKFFIDYIKSFPLRIKHKNVNVNLENSSHSITLAKARVVIKPKENLKDVIRYFDEEIEYLHKRLAETKNENQQEIHNLNKEINLLRIKIGEKIKETKDLILNSSISNIWLESFGLACIILGLILGTIPNLIQLLF